VSPLHEELAAQREAERLRVLKKYAAHLERGAQTHSVYAQIASRQAVTQEHLLEDLAERLEEGKTEEELGLGVDRPAFVLGQQMVELFNLQASIHTLGLSVCVAGLAGLAAQGVEVPDPPPLPEVDLGEGPE
jgi:hypothetical protein